MKSEVEFSSGSGVEIIPNEKVFHLTMKTWNTQDDSFQCVEGNISPHSMKQALTDYVESHQAKLVVHATQVTIMCDLGLVARKAISENTAAFVHIPAAHKKQVVDYFVSVLKLL